LAAGKNEASIRVYFDHETKQKVNEVVGKLGVKESAWIRALVIKEIKKIEREEK